VVSLAAYGLRTVQPAPEEIAAVRGVSSEDSCLIFMSPSAVRATVETFPDLEYLASLRIVSIGPVTSRAVRDAGLTVFAEAKEHTESGIVECLKAN
jgi:uroporphyrinogen-III synthase